MARASVARMRWALVLSIIGAAGIAGLACGRNEEGAGEEEGSQLIRVRFESEMKVILRDLGAAEETARAQGGRYLDLPELQRAYLTRPLPSSYRLQLSEVTADGYRAEIEHGPTGLRCELVVGAGPGAGRGSPRC